MHGTRSWPAFSSPHHAAIPAVVFTRSPYAWLEQASVDSRGFNMAKAESRDVSENTDAMRKAKAAEFGVGSFTRDSVSIRLPGVARVDVPAVSERWSRCFDPNTTE